MATMKRKIATNTLLGVVGIAVAAVAGWLLTHRYQVYVVRSLGGVASTTYGRTASKWFASLDAAKAFAAGQMGGVDFMGAFVADRSGAVLEGFHGHFLTGEEIDARLASFAQAGLELDPTMRAA